MAREENHVGLSPTVLKVVEQFVAAIRADDDIDSGACDRLKKLLRQGSVPKPDEITAALFDLPSDGDK